MSGAAEFELEVPASARGCPVPGPDGRPYCADYGIPCGGRDMVRIPRFHCPWCPWFIGSWVDADGVAADDREYHPPWKARAARRLARWFGC